MRHSETKALVVPDFDVNGVLDCEFFDDDAGATRARNQREYAMNTKLLTHKLVNYINDNLIPGNPPTCPAEKKLRDANEQKEKTFKVYIKKSVLPITLYRDVCLSCLHECLVPTTVQVRCRTG